MNDCIHHWVFEVKDGKEIGRCIKCLEERDFDRFFEKNILRLSGYWIDRKGQGKRIQNGKARLRKRRSTGDL